MLYRPVTSLPHQQSGSSLIEVLVAVLLLSFGMLSLGSMMAYAVQTPKLAAYRAAAANLAAGHVERMRANRDGFVNGSYNETMTYNATLASVTPCAYPNCTSDTIADLDKDASSQLIRRELPLGGMRMTCNGACTALDGNLWIIWQEPSTFATINTADSDECPAAATAPTFTAFSAPTPRCLLVRFKL